jgi:ABC-type transporter Mla subunit MlaD
MKTRLFPLLALVAALVLVALFGNGEAHQRETRDYTLYFHSIY